MSLVTSLMKDRKSIFAYLIALMAFTIPLPTVCSNIAIGLLALFWILTADFKKKFAKILANKFSWLFVSYFVLISLGFFYPNGEESMVKIMVKSLPFLVFPILIFSLDDSIFTKKNINLIVSAFVAGCLVVGVHFIFNYVRLYEQIDFSHQDPLKNIVPIQAAYYGLFLALATLSILYRIVDEWLQLTNNQRSILILVGIVLMAFSILTAARMSSFAMIFVGFVFVSWNIYKTKRYKLGLVLTVGAMIVFAMLLYFSPVLKGRVVELMKGKIEYKREDRPTGITLRQVMWQCGVELTVANPLNGIGPKGIQDALNTCYKEKNFWGHSLSYHLHNQYLQTSASFGVFGLIILISMLVIPAYFSIKAQGLNLYVIFIVLFALACLTESTFERQKGILFYAFFNVVFHVASFAKIEPRKKC